MTDVAIIGAGLTGMSCAYHLGRPATIYESGDRPGGLTRSIVDNGYTFDHGPHVLYSIDDYATSLIRDLLAGNFRAQAREAWIYHHRQKTYTQFPFQSHLYGLPADVVRDCLLGLFEAHLNEKEAEQPKPANYLEWMERTFGKGITKHLMVPYAEKIWTVSPDKMNWRWIGYRVPRPELGRIIDGALQDMSDKSGFHADFWYPEKGGIEALPRSLASRVEEIRLKHNVVELRPDQRYFILSSGEKVHYEFLVPTLALPELVRMTPDAPPAVKKAAESLEHNSILVVNVGVDRENLSPYHWVYFYEQPFCFHRISFPASFSPDTVPPGKGSISTEIAYSKHRPLSQEGIVERAIDDLILAGVLFPDEDIEVAHAIPLHYGYVIYDHDHRKNVKTIRNYYKSLGVIPSGRFGEWEYFNMDHSMMSGRRAAKAIDEAVEASGASGKGLA